jgi:DNA invertase Pin-like site-specific DNA recombinase
MERELTVERTRVGLEVARFSAGEATPTLGRKMTDSKSARKLLAGGVLVKDVAENLGVSVPTLYRWLPASS